MRLPFDRVVFLGNGQAREFSVQEFLALPMHQRVVHLLSRELAFYRGPTQIDRSTALKQLRSINASTTIDA
jgi:hypothetical protein